MKTRRRRRMTWGSSTCPTQLKVDRGGRLVDKKHSTGLRWEASWWRTSWLTCWWRWNSLLLQSSWKNINQSQRHIDLWISLHDSDSGWVGLTKDPSTEGGPRSVGVVLLLLILEPMECFKSFHSQCQWRWWQGNVQSAVVLCTLMSWTFAR